MSPPLVDDVIMNVSKMHAGHSGRHASSPGTQSSEFEFDSCSFPELNDEPPLSPKLLYSPNYSPKYSPSGNQLSAGEEKKRMSLRSLLNRRDLEQLAPLTNHTAKSNHQINKKGIKRQLAPVKWSPPASTSSSSSASPSSSPIHCLADHYTNPCKFDDNPPNFAGDASSPERKGCQKKSRKWALIKLDFLRKSPSPRADTHGTISNEPDHCSIAAAAEEAIYDDYLNHERDHSAAAGAAGEGRDINRDHLNQRTHHYCAALSAGEARFNQRINQSMNSNYRAAAYAAREAKLRINQSIDNFRVAAAVITKFESQRQSTSSVIGSGSSSPRRADNEMIRANDRKITKSAPISPARSPPRAESEFTRGRAPMSPHALHYEQQRARNEELRRKSFLPYRQSLLSPCFFPLSTLH